jgi:anti-anti-sigma factor
VTPSFPRKPPQHDGELQVSLTDLPPTTLLAEVRGELDGATAPHLQTRLTEALTSNGHNLFVVDLDQVPFLGAAGISALLQVRVHARRHDTAFRVIAAGRAVLRPLALLDLITTLEVHPTRALALR